MKTAIFLLSVGLLLAGCTNGGSTQDPLDPPQDPLDPAENPAPGKPDQENATLAWQTFQGNYSLMIDKQPPNVGVGIGVQNNCVMLNFGQFGRDWYEVRNGTAKLTWTPQNDLAESLHLVIFRADDGYQEEFKGASSIEAEFSSHDKRLKYPYAFSVETAPTEFALRQPVTLDVQFEYVAKVDNPNVDQNASCNLML